MARLNFLNQTQQQARMALLMFRLNNYARGVARRLVARNAAADVDGRRWQARPLDFARDERCVHFGLSG